MKIGFIEPLGKYGGLTIYDLGICKSLIDKNCYVTLYTASEDITLNHKNLKIINNFGDAFKKNNNLLIRLLFFLRGLISTIYDNKIKNNDLLFLHVFSFSLHELLLITIIANFFNEKKIFVNIHDPIPLKGNSNFIKDFLFNRILRKKNFQVTTHSNYSKDLLSNIFPYINVIIMPHSDVDFLYNNKISKVQAKKYLSLNKKHQYVLFFGQLKESKGINDLIRAWKLVNNNNNNNYKLLIVGNSSREISDSVRALIEEKKLVDEIIFINNFIEDSDVHYYFKASEFVVLPYKRIYSSGVIIRAIGYNTPVLVSDQPAFREFLGNDANVYFKTSDIFDLSSKINFCIQNKYKFRQQTAFNYNRINYKYNWDEVGEKMVRLFQR